MKKNNVTKLKKNSRYKKIISYLFFIFPSLAMANNIVTESINSVIKAVTDGPT